MIAIVTALPAVVVYAISMLMALMLSTSTASAQMTVEKPADPPRAHQYIVTGGVGFRYEIARKYGIHMGLDLAFTPENTAVYVQVGSAWARP